MIQIRNRYGVGSRVLAMYLSRIGGNSRTRWFRAFGSLLLLLVAGHWMLAGWWLEPTTVSSGDDGQEEEIEARFWFRKLPMPPIAVASSDALAVGACKRQLGKYLEELEKGTLWAVQMFDASVKYPHGIIDGQTRHLGSFDQCYELNAHVPNGNGEAGCYDDIRGKYCLVDYEYERKVNVEQISSELTLDFDPNDSAWEAVREKGDFRRIRRYMLQLALCVPAVCSAKDVQQALASVYENFAEKNNLSIVVKVDKKNCQTHLEQPGFSIGSISYCAVLLIILVFVIMSSLYDVSATEKEIEKCNFFGEQLLLCFSARRNIRNIFEVKHKHRGLDCVYMFRFLSTCMVIFGHRGFVYYLNPVVNERHFEMTFNMPSLIMLYNGPILVDGFFAIGGLLTSYNLLDRFEKTKSFDFVSFILFRFLRLTPVYAFVLFFNAFIFRHLGSGPLWESIVGSEADNCASASWAHLLYLNNYLTMDQICMFQSWYLAVDFHCYIFTLFFISEFCKRPRRIGYRLLAGVTFISILVPFIVTLVYRIWPLLIVHPYIKNLAMDEYFCNYYVKTHLRMTAYLVGVIAGVILYDYEASLRIPDKWSKILFILLYVVMTHVTQALGYPYLNPNSNESSLRMALYASLHRGIYAAGISSLVLLIAMGDGLESQYKFFAAYWAQPLARLTYSAFLSHTIIQTYQAATARSTRTFSAHNLIWDFAPDVIHSFILAFAIVIVIEAPFGKLQKLLFMRYMFKAENEELEKKESAIK